MNASFSFRMDVCVESALLSSPTAWNSANRMAAMGETLLYDGIRPGNCFSFGTELENRLLVEMLSTRHTEHVQAHRWRSLWFEFYSTLVPFLSGREAFGHGFTTRIILFATKLSIRVKRISEYITGLFLKSPFLRTVGLMDALRFLD